MTLPHDPHVAAWLAATGPEEGPPESLARALAATRRTRKRPRWTFPERWLPVQLTMTRTRSQRPIFAVVMLALLILALVVTALYIGSQRRLPPSPFHNGAVVYAEQGDLFIADELDGTRRVLVAGPEKDSDPLFSPQGDRIAFVRLAPDGIKVMAVTPDGTDVTELATVPGGVTGLGWSPDGRALLVSYFHTGDQWYQTDVIASDGSESRTLNVGVGGHVIAAAWRPDSRQILFRGTLHADDDWSDSRMYIAGADGTNVRELPIGVRFAWSSDGKRISYLSGDPESVVRINIADIDEAGTLTRSVEVNVGEHEPQWYEPQWSPDGSRIAVMLRKGTRQYVGVVDSDGSNFRIVVPEGSAFGGNDFIWSPDGRSLVFVDRPDVDDAGNVGAWGTGWSVDVATGEQTEVRTPVESWQRLAP